MMHAPFPTKARRAANHSSVLLRPSEAPVETGPEFERFGERLALALAACMAEVASDPEVRVTSLGTQTLAGCDFAGHCGPLAAMSLHRFGVAGHGLCLALDGRMLIGLLDRTFGGSGRVGSDLPAMLPPTARLMGRRVEQRMIEAIAAELGGLEFQADDAVIGSRGPFAADAELSSIAIEVCALDGSTWRHVVALETTSLTSLLPKRASTTRAASSRRKPGITEPPFADLPLSASARLVDMAMPLHRLARLEPGMVLPIMVARSVPLQVGEVVLARGTIGEVDDQVALQITHTFTGQTNTAKEIR